MVAVQVKCVVHEELGLRAANHTRALLRIRRMQIHAKEYGIG